MAKSRGLRTGPLPDRQPLRHDAPAPSDRVPPFLLLRQLDGDVLIAPFPRNALSPAAAVLVQIGSLSSSAGSAMMTTG